jgi:hypothetical protein
MYSLNSKELPFKHLYREAQKLGYTGARGGFWTATFLQGKGKRVFEKVRGGWVEVGT